MKRSLAATQGTGIGTSAAEAAKEAPNITAATSLNIFYLLTNLCISHLLQIDMHSNRRGICTVSLGENCSMMAFSASAPLARTLSQNALEGSVQGGLISEPTLARNRCECQP